MIVKNTQERLGDNILCEAALSEWSRINGNKVQMFLKDDHYRCLWEKHPDVELLDECPDEGIEPDCSKAFFRAHDLKKHFGAGYFEQFGLGVPKAGRFHPVVHGTFRYSGQNGPVVLACNARSCRSFQGEEANIMPPIEWWDRIVSSIDRDVYSLGTPEDQHPNGTIRATGENFFQVAQFIANASLLIRIETGIVHLAASLGTPIIFLSCATPHWFASPPGAKVHVAKKPSEFKTETVIKIMKEVLR